MCIQIVLSCWFTCIYIFIEFFKMIDMQMRRDDKVASSNVVGVGSSKRRGCIRSSKGPWLVRRMTKNKGIVTKYRHPSERERLNNKRRERKRRSITHNIFAGLKAHGNYQLPKNADSNDLLKALSQEAGWHVHDDGTIFRSKHDHDQAIISNSTATAAGHNIMMPSFGVMEDEEASYCNCKEKDELQENAQQLGVYNFKFYQLLPNSMAPGFDMSHKVPDTTLSL